MGLFGNKHADQTPLALPATTDGLKPASIFGRNLAINGRISGEDDVKLHGCLKGDIDLKGHLAIGREAAVEGNITADTITAGGEIFGTLTAGSTLHIETSASISGEVTTPILSVQEGAVFNGELKMGNRQQRRGSDEN